jgi:hypothetical protein
MRYQYYLVTIESIVVFVDVSMNVKLKGMTYTSTAILCPEGQMKPFLGGE